MLPARLQLTLRCVFFPLLRLIHLVKNNLKNNKPLSGALPERNFEILLINRSFLLLAAVPAQEGKPGNRPCESALVPEAFHYQRLSCCATDAITAQRSERLTR